MTWISCTEMPETSAQVLLVYVLSSRTASKRVSGEKEALEIVDESHICSLA